MWTIFTLERRPPLLGAPPGRPARDVRLLLLAALLLVAVGLLGRSVLSDAPQAELGRFGWQLTESATGLSGAGVDRDALPAFSGAVTQGMTISQVKISSPLDLSSTPNVTLDRVWLAPNRGRQALVLGPGTVLRDSDVDGAGMQAGERIGVYGSVVGDYTISRVSITGVSVGAWLDGDGRGSVSETFIGRMRSIAGAHVDGVTRRAGTGPLSISRSRVDASGAYVTGALFLQDTYASTISGVYVTDTLLEGAGYVVTLENLGSGVALGMDNVRVRPTGWGPIVVRGQVDTTQWEGVQSDEVPLALPSPLPPPPRPPAEPEGETS